MSEIQGHALLINETSPTGTKATQSINQRLTNDTCRKIIYNLCSEPTNGDHPYEITSKRQAPFSDSGTAKTS
jgi:hypothetical protein